MSQKKYIVPQDIYNNITFKPYNKDEYQGSNNQRRNQYNSEKAEYFKKEEDRIFKEWLNQKNDIYKNLTNSQYLSQYLINGIKSNLNKRDGKGKFTYLGEEYLLGNEFKLSDNGKSIIRVNKRTGHSGDLENRHDINMNEPLDRVKKRNITELKLKPRQNREQQINKKQKMNDDDDDDYIDKNDFIITPTHYNKIASQYIIKPVQKNLNIINRKELIYLWKIASNKLEDLIYRQYENKDINVHIAFNAIFKVPQSEINNKGKQVMVNRLVDRKTWGNRDIINITSVDNLKEELYKRFYDTIARFHNPDLSNWEGSGWTLYRFVSFEVYVDTRSLYGQKHFELPDLIRNKKACINIQNTDNDCFLYCIVAKLYFDDDGHNNPQLPQRYKQKVEELKKILVEKNLYSEYDGFDMYNHMNKLPEIEKELNCGIAILRYNKEVDDEKTEDKEDMKYKYTIPQPMYRPNTSYKKIVELLYMEEEESTDSNIINSHFALIKNMSRLISSDGNKKEYCPKCYHQFRISRITSKEAYNKHIKICKGESGINYTNIEFPLEGTNNIYEPSMCKTISCPFAMYCDFEAFVNGDDERHVPNSFGCYVHCDIEEHSDEDVTILTLNDNETQSDFFDRIWQLLRDNEARIKKLLQLFKSVDEMRPLTAKQQELFDNQKECQLCKETFFKTYQTKFGGKTRDNILLKCRDHNHLTGEYRFALCSKCNLRIKETYEIPVIFHNLGGYDAHFLLHHIKSSKSNRINVLTQSSEKVIGFTSGKLRFIDSFRFIASSLEKIVETNSKNPENFYATKKVFRDKYDLFLRKGIYPYEYPKSINHMKEMIRLPKPKCFYSKVSNSGVSDDDYLYAIKVYAEMNCKNFLDFHNIYLKSDITLLSDCFNQFRKAIYKSEGLEVLRYYTLPSVAYDSVIKYYYDNKYKKFYGGLASNHYIKNFDENQEDMWRFFKQHLRGGFVCAMTKYLEANNKYLNKYNPDDIVSYIIYCDVNSLYPFIASKYKQPKGNYKWETRYDGKSLDVIERDILAIDKEHEVGYVFEVDLEPTEDPNLLKMFEKFPPLAESKIVDVNDESPLNKKILKDIKSVDVNNNLIGDKVPKLIADMKPKYKYKICGLLLKQVLELKAFKLKKVHSVISYDQEYILKDWIDQRYKERKAEGATEVESQTKKLAMNAMIGKWIEAQEKYGKYEILSEEKIVKKRLNTWHLQSKIEHFLDGGYVGISSNNAYNKITRAIAVGTVLLDFAKLHMNSVVYDCFYKVYNHEDVELAYTDTDSHIIKISSKNPNFDIYDDIKNNDILKKYFNESELGGLKLEYNLDKVNKKQNGISEFVCLSEKMYSVLIDNKDSNTQYNAAKAKGINLKSAKLGISEKEEDFYEANKISHKDYYDVLFNKSNKIYTSENRIVSNKHSVKTEETFKQGFNNYSNKRYVCDDSIHTHAYGYLELLEKLEKK